MKILVTGASGLVGKRLVPELKKVGHSVLKLSRKPAEEDDQVSWDAVEGFEDDEFAKRRQRR